MCLIQAKYHAVLKLVALTLFVNTINISYVIAEDYVHSANVVVGAEMDSNPRMLSEKQSVWLTRINPRYTITKKNDDDERFANLAFFIQRSSDETLSINRNDPSLSLGWKRDFSLGQFTANARASKTSTRSSEIDETGELVADASRIDRIFDFSWTHYLSQRLSSRIAAGYSNIDFIGNTQLNNFDVKRLNSSLNYDWSPTLQVYGLVNFTKQQLESGDVNVLNPMVGFNWLVYEPLTLVASAGVNKSSGNSGGTGSALTVIAKYITSSTESYIDVSRSLFPTGANGFIESDRVKAGLTYQISDNYHSTFTYTFNKNNSLNTNETSVFRLALAKNLSNSWVLNAYYAHRELQNSVRSASADILGLNVSFNHADF